MASSNDSAVRDGRREQDQRQQTGGEDLAFHAKLGLDVAGAAWLMSCAGTVTKSGSALSLQTAISWDTSESAFGMGFPLPGFRPRRSQPDLAGHSIQA